MAICWWWPAQKLKKIVEIEGREHIDAALDSGRGIILLTGHATVEKTVEAMKAGAMDLIEKPADLDALSEKIKDAHHQKAVLVEKGNQDRVIDMLKIFGM